MRRLAAIMFTDMVGYSALTQKNEALALDLLAEHRRILRPIFVKHDGREIETAGDSFFVEFGSAVHATNCAIEIQSTLNERNNSVEKENQIFLRIGLHIGDVVQVENHVHGDGVNIAARIEPLAHPGGICISEDVARQIRNKVSYPVMKLGEERLKNISMPMDIYCVVLPWLAKDKRIGRAAGKQKNLVRIGLTVGIAAMLITSFILVLNNAKVAGAPSSHVRLAVLPLDNISEEKDEYFADGMTEELISSLSKISGLSVIARTSVMKYKEGKDIKKIGKELMVNMVLDGSVRKDENKAKIHIFLIDVVTQERQWGKEYDRKLNDIFTVQSEIAQNIADELQIRLVTSEKEQLAKAGTDNMMAFQEYLLGKHQLNQRTPESIRASVVHFENAIGEDSSFALPYASLAYAYTLIGGAGYGNITREIAAERAKSAVMKALEIDSTLAEAHAALGYISFRIDWDWAAAEKEFRKAIQLKPGYATAHEWYALYLAIHTRLDDALKEIKTAHSLDPLSPSVNTGLARIHYFRNETDLSLQQISKTLQMDPDYAEAHFTAGMTYFKTKEYDKSIDELKKAADLSGRRPVILGMLGSTYARQGKKEEANKVLKELETGPANNDKLYAAATIKNNLGQANESLDIFEKLVDDKYGIMIYMNVEREFFPNNKEKRFENMLKKLELKR